MMTAIKQAALASAIYFSRLQLAGEAVDTDDKRIRASGLYPDIRPGEAAWFTFNRPLHGTSPETARPWVKPQHGTTDIYHPGEYMIWTDGSVCRCLRDTNFSPEESPADWEMVSDSDTRVKEDDM